MKWSLLAVLLVTCASAAAETRQVRVNAKVRVAPTMTAAVVGVLPAGSSVLRLGPAAAGWSQIAFPQAVFGYVHAQQVERLADGSLRVGADGARLRAEARVLSPELAVLPPRQALEWSDAAGDGEAFRGRQIGEWLAVRVPAMPLYVNDAVLVDPGAAVAPASPRRGDPEAVYQQALRDYAAVRAALSEQPTELARDDLLSLELDLQQVADEHPQVRTRLEAARLQALIRRLVAVADRFASRGLPLPTTELPAAPEPESAASAAPLAEAARRPDVIYRQPPLPETPPAGSQPPVASATQAPEASESPVPPDLAEPGEPVADPVVTAPPTVDGLEAELPQSPSLPGEPAAATVTPPTVADPAAISGWVTELQVPELAVFHALKNEQGETLALLRVPPGRDLQLLNHLWQRVRIRGERTQVQANIDGLERSVLLVTVHGIDAE